MCYSQGEVIVRKSFLPINQSQSRQGDIFLLAMVSNNMLKTIYSVDCSEGIFAMGSRSYAVSASGTLISTGVVLEGSQISEVIGITLSEINNRQPAVSYQCLTNNLLFVLIVKINSKQTLDLECDINYIYTLLAGVDKCFVFMNFLQINRLVFFSAVVF